MNRAFRYALLSTFYLVAVFVTSEAQNASPAKVVRDVVPPLLHSMAGRWNVSQRMWTGAGQQPTGLPPAVAQRRLLEGGILQEEMELAPHANSDPFKRMGYFVYNAVTSQFEYFSIDSRAPQMMNERSYGDDPPKGVDRGISLWGGIFVAPKWGDATNAAFRYRLLIGPVQENRQVVQLYLTPVSGEPASEFLAFEYVYTRSSGD